jgi:hypothetical protein
VEVGNLLVDALRRSTHQRGPLHRVGLVCHGK